MDVAGASAVVTGAGRGIGAAIADQLAQIGMAPYSVTKQAEDYDRWIAGMRGYQARLRA